MIIRIEASGGSFLGAGKYYLHDKLNGERPTALQAQAHFFRLGSSVGFKIDRDRRPVIVSPSIHQRLRD